MIDKYLRPIKEKLLIPFAKVIDKYLNPNQITLIAFSFGILCSMMIIFKHPYFALIFWIFNRILDGLDGTVARLSNKQTDWGGYLDIMLDFIIYAAIPISFTSSYGNGHLDYAALAIMLAVFYINSASWMYLSALVEKKTFHNNTKQLTSISMPTGLIEGAETIFLYGILFVFPEYLAFEFFIISGLTIIGIFQRMIWGYNNLKD